MCNSDLVYFIGAVINKKFEDDSYSNEDLLTRLNILKDNNYSIKIDINQVKEDTTFSYTEIGIQLDYLYKVGLIDNSYRHLGLILNDSIDEFINKEIERGGK